MNDATADKTTDWKDQYFKSLLEIEDKERVWRAQVEKLEASVLRLCEVLGAPSRELDEKIKAFRQASKNGAMRSALDEALNDIVKAALNVAANSVAAARSLAPVSKALLSMVETLDLPNEALPELVNMQSALSADPDHVLVEQSIATIARWIGEIERRRAKEQEESKRYLQRVSAELIALQQHILLVNGLQAESMTATAQLHENIQLDVSTIRSSADAATSLAGLKSVIDGHLRDIQMNMKVFFDVERKRHGEAMSANDSLHKRLEELTDETKRLRESLKETTARIYLDSLTGVANRLSYDERVEQEHARWKRYGGKLSMLIVDIDLFKAINDNFGHSVGDELLKTVASVLRQNLREVDFVARYGGEEFVILLPGTGLADSKKVAEKLRSGVENCRHAYQQSPLTATISCGIAEFKLGETPQQVFQRADQGLYMAKRGGRNRIAAAA